MEPIDVIDAIDTGDDVQLRFHYQHAYGVILALSAIRELEKDVVFWFEQHEDILRKNKKGNFSYFQIKTRKPELGYWTLTSEALLKSIKKFTQHEAKFSSSSLDYSFVSNAKFLKTGSDTNDLKKISNSPVNFFKNIESICNENCQQNFMDKFNQILKYCECDREILKLTLKKVRLIDGPGYESIYSDLSSIHFSDIDYCSQMKLKTIHKIRDELIYNVYKASSLIVDTSEKHMFNVIMDTPDNPVINSKKITVKEFKTIIEKTNDDKEIFRYMPYNMITLKNGKKNIPVLFKKLRKGGLENSIDTMERRALSAEYNLIEASVRNPEKFKEIFNQLENVVLSEASDIKLINTNNHVLNSNDMMRDFIFRMREISINEPDRIFNYDIDMLMGIAGLLTGECKIWWSDFFNLDEYE